MNDTAAKSGRVKSLYKQHLWLGRLILATLIIIIVLIVVRISLPYTIIYSATYWLGTQGVDSTIEDISININKGTFSVIGATGSKDGTSVFNIGKASIDWEWRPLSGKTIHIKSIELEDFKLIAAQYTDAVEIAGVLIRDSDVVEQPPVQEDDAVAWGASLNQIDFRDLGFCFRQFNTGYDKVSPEHRYLDYCGNVGLVRWQGDFSLDNTAAPDQGPGQKLTVDGALQIEKLSLQDNILEGKLIVIDATNLPGIKINGVNDIRLDSVNIDQLALLQRSGHSRHKHAVEFSALDVTGISISNSNTIAIESISLNRPIVSMSRDENGAFKYEQWLKKRQSAQAETGQAVEGQKGDDAVLDIRLGGIQITDSETCYQQAASKDGKNAPAIDYCLNLASSEWGGNIAISTPANDTPLKLSLTGDLTVSGLISTNNLLQRDLISFDKLAIHQIAVNDLDDLAFGNLVLNNAAGLELTDTEDKHTITIAGVDIASFNYRNNAIAIDSLAVNDLGVEITQHEDGSLDFEKWKIEAAQQQASTGKEEQPEAEAEPVKIKLGEFSLDTTRIVEFSDMSVTPNMVIGLKEIHLNIKQLDTDKPDQKSPIQLSAKTTRHGTIDIKGVAMPFASKPSFDATGKITGLDLRAASPKAEQAIGHIIKSGQMDADLKLLSVQGQLDSNIALVLHHFNLKAKSKKDAAALDETFGMPINQSMMLLKDKKGRIKLDIPITGDINNPDFDPTDAIIKATTKATAVTLVTFYTPYGLAFAGGNILFNLATAMNFDPLLFDAGASQLTDAHMEQLAKLSELLVERPGVHLTLCGLTNLNDREKISTDKTDREKIKSPSDEQLQQLRRIASERQENVKNHLVSVGKVEHNRLILCEPEHSDDADAIGGVEISI